jgi:hypothetical protein
MHVTTTYSYLIVSEQIIFNKQTLIFNVHVFTYKCVCIYIIFHSKKIIKKMYLLYCFKNNDLLLLTKITHENTNWKAQII